MAEKKQFRAIKGVRDILPPESAAWNRVEQAAREVFEAYSYGEIRLPIFEETDLFARSIGTDTDVVAKEMFTFRDRGSGQFEYLRQSLSKPLATGDERSFVERVKALRDEIKERMNEGIPQENDRFVSIEETLTAGLRDVGDAPRPTSEAWLRFRNNMGKILESLEWPGQQITLRPEATASVCRAYIEHGMQTRPGNVKLYYIGPMFRRERPQKGRYRQFYQIGAEVLGQSDAPAIDAELIEMLLAFFARIGLGEGSATGGVRPPLRTGATAPDAASSAPTTAQTRRSAPTEAASGLTLYYNSIGCRECRPKYVAALKAALQAPEVREKLGPDSQRRIETNPLRVLDSKVESEQAVIETLPRIGEHLCAACREHLAALREQFKLRGIEGVENWRLVRGLDYYTRTTFEITAPGLGSQNAVCGGGRYDGLVELLGGPPTKGIGFAIGTDRVMLALEHLGKLDTVPGCDVFVAWMGAAAQGHAIRLARKLREAGFRVEVPAEELKFRKSLDLANRLGARYALIIGENEIAAGRYALKRLADGTQRELTEGELLEFLQGEKAV